mmetsp:Transcript_100021/g.322366  ORF Transcript_100021/g.322366 Transcript_100021/m.322366 type:complete len:113 (+) Transcript_100021:248-586(+)
MWRTGCMWARSSSGPKTKQTSISVDPRSAVVHRHNGRTAQREQRRQRQQLASGRLGHEEGLAASRAMAREPRAEAAPRTGLLRVLLAVPLTKQAQAGPARADLLSAPCCCNF